MGGVVGRKHGERGFRAGGKVRRENGQRPFLPIDCALRSRFSGRARGKRRFEEGYERGANCRCRAGRGPRATLHCYFEEGPCMTASRRRRCCSSDVVSGRVTSWLSRFMPLSTSTSSLNCSTVPVSGRGGFQRTILP